MGDFVEERDCAVCLQRCHHPTQLPCGHIFCFLCVKGVAIQSRKCAMCRAEIPPDYLDHPVLLEKEDIEQPNEQQEDQYQWYYEGRNGWWKYDERSNIELEEAFNSGQGDCSLLLAGALYCIDFQNMMQVRRSDVTRRRRVRRDNSTLPSKGIAGIKRIETLNEERSKSDSEDNANEAQNNVSNDDSVQVLDNTEESIVHVNDSEELNDVINVLSSINLSESNSPDVPVMEDT